MAEEVLACLRNKERLLIEAGTGIGKSYAYLIPAIVSKEKTVVSTATLALQDQLVNKDLVLLQQILPQKFSFALLKGKNNYLCLKRGREFQPELGKGYEKFAAWVSETVTGDRNELSFIPDFWGSVCGDSDDCSAGQCPDYTDCYYYSHYRSLFNVDLLIVNHHLLVYDLLSEANVLPFHSQLVIDEAHKIEDVICNTAGSTLNYTKVMWVLYRLKGLKVAVEGLFEPVETFFKRKDISYRTVYPVPQSVVEALKNLKDLFAFDNIIKRITSDSDLQKNDEMRDRVDTTVTYIKSLAFVMDDLIDQGNDEKVYFMTGSKRGVELCSSLVECRTSFCDLLNSFESTVLTSATLTAGGNFGFFKARLGLDEGSPFRERMIGSPYDFRKQAIVYINRDLPKPDKQNKVKFEEQSLKVIENLIAASRGRALVLFTSYSHLNYVRENLNTEYPVKSQGEMPPARLISWFKKRANAVLLATATFWQGIDIKGDALSMVIIVKMPFGSPGDPVYDERCRRLGDRWFPDLALPSAILTLRQGFGRLIRGVDEKGVIALLDTRLVKNSYGKSIISSLPDMEIVHDIEEVKKYFDRMPVVSSRKEIA